jgi:branched-chain amino acid transport system permease protein
LRASLLLLVPVIGLPFAAGDYWAYQLGLYFLYATAATGLGLCWGWAGFLPLGQALFFGLAAYLSGFALIGAGDWGVLLLPLAALAPGLVALLIGLAVFRRPGESGPYFSLITLALSLLAFQVAINWNAVTGGFEGLKGIPGLPGLDDYAAGYYLAAGALGTTLGLAAWLSRAPIGILWRAVAQNERRVQLLGFDTNRLKALAFGCSGLMAGIGGVIYAPQQGIVAPQLTGFELSAALVIWTAVGGRAALLGPALGAVVVGSLGAELRDRVPGWEVLMAVFFILVVIAMPQGLAGLAARFTGNAARSRGPGLPAPARRHGTAAARLQVEDVGVQLGAVRILDRLSLTLDRRGIFCLIGPNGAGKTSTFNLLSGELKATAGRVAFAGRDITGLAPHRIAGAGIGRKLQIPSVFPELAIADNLAIALWSGRATALDLLRPSLRRWTSPMHDALCARYPFLVDPDRTAGTLSHGERQILELAMALLTEPRLLLLDEPCAGLSPEETAAVTDLIRWAGGYLDNTIVIIEHDMSLVKELAETVHVLHNGTLLASGGVAEIQADPTVRAVYVGAEK